MARSWRCAVAYVEPSAEAPDDTSRFVQASAGTAAQSASARTAAADFIATIGVESGTLGAVPPIGREVERGTDGARGLFPYPTAHCHSPRSFNN